MWDIQKFTISYNANGGSGAPTSQTKTYGTNITLSSTKPTRSRYTFQGWATSATGTVTYKLGTTYSTNANLNLYAIWKVGDSHGPISDYMAHRWVGNDGSYLYFKWDNIETFSSEGITVEGAGLWGNELLYCFKLTSLPNRLDTVYGCEPSRLHSNYVKITLADGSWCEVTLGTSIGDDCDDAIKEMR